MIQQVLDSLFSQPEFPNKNEKYAVNIIIREPLLMHFFFDNGTDYFVKVATKKTIDNRMADEKDLFSSVRRIGREYEALIKYREIYPGLLPESILFRKFDRHTLLVTKGIKHSAVKLEDILRRKQDRHCQIQQLLIGKDRIMSINNKEQNRLSSDLDQAINSLPSYLLQSMQKIRHTHDWDNMLAALPLIPQHGDLAVNNFGLTSTGLILFDWEDYAFIKTPGFDLSILLVSGCEFNVSKLMLLVKKELKQTNNNSFLLPIIEGMGIKASQIYDLMMVNLIIFYQLKRQHGYGSEIIDSTESVLKALASTVAKS